LRYLWKHLRNIFLIGILISNQIKGVPYVLAVKAYLTLMYPMVKKIIKQTNQIQMGIQLLNRKTKTKVNRILIHWKNLCQKWKHQSKTLIKVTAKARAQVMLVILFPQNNKGINDLVNQTILVITL
jgi:hypothetical protein